LRLNVYSLSLRKIFTTNFSEVNNARGLKGERRPADVIGNAVHVMPIATGQITDDVPTPEQEGKSAAAVELGRLGKGQGERNVGKTARSDCEKSGKSALEMKARFTRGEGPLCPPPLERICPKRFRASLMVIDRVLQCSAKAIFVSFAAVVSSMLVIGL
jgi:hypothetical protein